MRILICGKVLLMGAFMTAGLVAWGQTPSLAKPSSSIDVAVSYNPTLNNVITNTGFSMQGGSLQIHGQFWRGLGVVADVASLHTVKMRSSTVGLDLITVTFGPRYTWSPANHRYAFFGQFLAGEANGFNSVFPNKLGYNVDANNGANSIAIQTGGGMNVSLRGRLQLRAFEVNWLRTQFPNTTTNVQNNVRMGTGVIYKF